ncbi:DmpA family aminopeptidase [Spongiimicrobium salis]|uniref:DmpA family aminopeptidase n=1 Tax=Spongiimicrobium salis TaxID=1667022 RepID=UPI00374D26AE
MKNKIHQYSKKRLRDYGIEIGILQPGNKNAITDVEGVQVGHTTLIKADSIRTGVTAILPHQQNIFKFKVPAAIYMGNGFGKLIGYSQVQELGNIETPIILTNTLSAPTASNALISYTLEQSGNEKVKSVNPIVGETNDGILNDIRGRHITETHVLDAIKKALPGKVEEGNFGAGTGTVCFGFKGGIGTSSRLVSELWGKYTVGVLVQTNFGGILEINGVPIAKELNQLIYDDYTNADGSCMIVVITDAPLDARNLRRVAKRAMLGLAKTGGIASNGSGDFVIALSTYKKNLVDHSQNNTIHQQEVLPNEKMTPLFLATIEATEEAILNSLFAAEDMNGHKNRRIEGIPKQLILDTLKKYGRKITPR